MKLLTLFFTNLLAFLLVTRVRQVVAVILVGANNGPAAYSKG